MADSNAPGAHSSFKFYFMLTFWGEEFREYFYSLLLPTLLAPNNIPVLKSWPGSKLVVSTTRDDWDRLTNRPLMHELAKYVEPLPIFIDYPAANASIQLHMSHGHRIAALRAYEDGAVAGFLAPDLLCSDGLIKTAVDLIISGKKAVVAPALRFSMESVLKHVTAAALPKHDRPTTLPPSFAGSLAVKALHREISRYDFDGSQFDDYPLWTFWRVPGREGLILYTVSWALLLADYAAIPRLADETLNESTIDGFYVSSNFGHLRETDQVAVLSDSAQGMFISLTPDNALKFPSAQILNALFDLFAMGLMKRLTSIHRVHHSHELDPWRRWLHSVPVVLHGDETDGEYQTSVARSQRMMTAAMNFSGTSDYEKLQALLISGRASEKTYKLPPRALFRIFIPIVNALWFCRTCLLVGGQVLDGKISALHLVRRALHVASFGLIFYPAPSTRSPFPRLPRQ